MSDRNERPSSTLDTLEHRIETARRRHQPEGPTQGRSALGAAFRLSTELIAAVVVGGGLGYILDAWLETGPAFLLIFFALGVAAGFFNVLRAAREMNEQNAPRSD
ncbi:MAG: hypothetical protein GC199_06255 [Alphaproteobacteria bacterium]|nr:hypothetical protein [Alphaproteobacteria bacterium]